MDDVSKPEAGLSGDKAKAGPWHCLKRRDSLIFLALILFGILSVYLSFYPVIYTPGWPESFETHAWNWRIAVYHNAMRHGDLIPLWSPHESLGMGSAMPLFYHRLFNTVAAGLMFVTGTIKSASILTIFIFSLIAICGIYRIGRIVGLDWRLSFVIAVIFPHLNYVRTDLFIRGAFAEFCALCLCVWLLWWCVNLLRFRRFSLTLGFIMWLIFLSHSVTAFYSVLIPAVASLLFIRRYPGRWRRVVARGVISLLIFLVLIAPLIAGIWYVRSTIDLSYLQEMFPSRNYRELWRYIYEPFDWRTIPICCTMQLDSFIMVGFIGMAAVLTWMSFKKKQKIAKFETSIYLFTGINLLVYLWLQTPLSAFFYDYFPGAGYIQFPWRCLTYITLFLVLGYQVAASRLYKTYPRAIFIITSLIAVVTVIVNVARPFNKKWVNAERFENPKPFNWREYFPNYPGRKMSEKDFAMTIIRQFKSGNCDVLGRGAKILPYAPKNYLETVYLVKAPNATEVAVLLNYSGLETVLMQQGDKWLKVESYRTSDDSRVRFKVPAGTNRFKVLKPALKHLPELLWTTNAEQ